VQNTKTIDIYMFINLLVISIFLLVNPLYALFFSTLICLTTEKVSNFLVGVLFVISFSIMFSNQVFLPDTDIGSYIHMYETTKNDTFFEILIRYIENINGREWLWFFYCKIIGILSGYSKEVFVCVTYTMIFSLSAYVAHLASENNRYNFSLFLFGLVFLELVLFSNIYDLWRTITASLVFIISLLYDHSKSKIVQRVVMYSSMFIHSSLIILVLAYEVFSFLMRNSSAKINTTIFYFKLVFLTIIAILFLSFFSNALVEYLNSFGSSFKAGYYRYAYLNYQADFDLVNYLQPLYVLIFFYFLINYKSINKNEAFILSSFIVLVSMPFIANEFSILYARSNIAPRIVLILFAIKLLRNFNVTYSFLFVILIFIIRMYTYLSNELTYNLERIADGNFFSINYGLILSIFHFYEPKFL